MDRDFINFMYTTEGIILKKMDIGEADMLVTIYTKDFGKIRALAQGVKKESAKLKGHLEPLGLSSISFVIGKRGERLTHAELHEFLPSIRHDLQKLTTGWRFASLVDEACMPGVPDKAIWNLFRAVLRDVEEAQYHDQKTADMLVAAFTRRLEEHLGNA